MDNVRSGNAGAWSNWPVWGVLVAGVFAMGVIGAPFVVLHFIVKYW